MKSTRDINFEWAESLPSNCPPSDARQPQNETFYRLVESNPPTEKDFYSHRLLYPNRNFSSSECIVRAISILASLDACNDIKRLPLHKGKKIVRLTLPPESGLIKQTGGENHFSWWRSKNFNPITLCIYVSI